MGTGSKDKYTVTCPFNVSQELSVLLASEYYLALCCREMVGRTLCLSGAVLLRLDI